MMPSSVHCMAKKITIVCDRCGARFPGVEFPIKGVTAGFYVRGWEPKFFRDGEEYLCDDCMFKDPRYIKIYGKRHIIYPK